MTKAEVERALKRETVARKRAEAARKRSEAAQTIAEDERDALRIEVAAKNQALAEALAQQMTTAEILRVISSSPSDAQPVFEAIADSSVRLCESVIGAVYLLRDGMLEIVAHRLPDGGEAWLRRFPRPLASSPAFRWTVEHRAVAHFADVAVDPRVTERGRRDSDAMGLRATVIAPMLRGDTVIGFIALGRREVRPFTDGQIDTIKTFADQAVIAIENVQLFTELQEKNRELADANARVTEALEQQTATAEILRVISGSPTDAQPVFNAIAQSAANVCAADWSGVSRFDGELVHLNAVCGFTDEAVDVMRRHVFPYRPDERANGISRALRERRPVHIDDVGADPAWRFPVMKSIPEFRTFLAVPMLREGQPIGTITVGRSRVRPFSDTQIELLKTFAEQAVIAIENVRLFTELQEKNRSLTEALAQQTATADVLRIISSSPTDVQPIFDAIVTSAVRLLGGFSGVLARLVNDGLHLAASTSTGGAGDDALRSFYPFRVDANPIAVKVIREKAVCAIADTEADLEIWPEFRDVARARGFRSDILVPLIHDDRAVGLIAVTAREPHPWTDEEIALLQTFADQAVIAIENVRLFTELQEKNRAISEALEQQTATSEILRVISGSPTDVQPVFDAIAQSAATVCGAENATVFRFDGSLIHFASHYNWTRDELDALARVFPIPPGQGSLTARAILARSVAHVPDIAADPEFTFTPLVQAGFRTVLSVPMLRNGEPIGAISIGRREVRPFSGNQIALLETFAEQAVIAIENVRLFKELDARNRDLVRTIEQRTATAEILRVISSTPTDVQPVFDAIAASARRLCGGTHGSVFVFDGGLVHLGALDNVNPEAVEAFRRTYPVVPGDATATGRAILERRVVAVPDLAEDPKYGHGHLGRMSGFRSVLSVPMLRDGDAVGAITVTRETPGVFSESEVELLQTFADQAVIAIENVRLFTELQEKNRALTEAHRLATEALDQQTATSDILRVISSSPTDANPVFDSIADSAARLTRAHFCVIFRFDGTHADVATVRPAGLPFEGEYRRTYPIDVRPGALFATPLLEGRIRYTIDTETDPSWPETARQRTRLLGVRSSLWVPMLKDGKAVGMIAAARSEPGRFSDKETELLQTFADQAVIAIENVRLFTELQEKNRAVIEALEQQTATSEILGVISSSPTDIQPVFDALLERALTLCEASHGSLYQLEGDALRHVATRGTIGGSTPVSGLNSMESAPGRAIRERQPVHLEDSLRELDWQAPEVAAGIRRNRVRTVLAVPLLREQTAIGAILIRRLEVRPFNEKQIRLLQTFTDQAVIAIENVRLFKELEARNRELTTALDQQTATSDILRVISRSQTNVGPVFDAIVQSAVQLLRAYTGSLTRVTADRMDLAAFTSTDAAADALFQSLFPQSLATSASPHARAIRARAVVNIADSETDPRVIEIGRAYARTRGYRSMVVVPMVHHDEAVGTIAITRREPGGFSDDEIALLETFADQAVIAIENVRLFTELQERTRQLTRSVDELTALGDVSRAVSSTLDLETVLTTIVTRANDLCATDGAGIYEFDNVTGFHLRATKNFSDELVDASRAAPLRHGEGIMGRLAETRQPTQIPDITVEGAYQSRVREILIRNGYRALLSVPLLRDDDLIGALTVGRRVAGEFPAEIVDLLRTFAAQSSLAIQNARLFHELEVKSRELEVASQHKSEFLASMSHELRTPLNAIIGFSDVLIERMFGEVNEKQEEYLRDILGSGKHLLSLINDILDLSKIEAGRMDLDLADFDLPMAIDNALTLMRERAVRRGIALEHSVDGRLGEIKADERKVKQVLLNLLSNAVKFTPEGGRISMRAAPVDDMVEISVSDTGIGIASEDHEAVFEEFRQVGHSDKKAEGTGLGLALCRKFIELHGGRISVKSQVGAGSTFTFTIPVRAA